MSRGSSVRVILVMSVLKEKIMLRERFRSESEHILQITVVDYFIREIFFTPEFNLESHRELLTEGNLRGRSTANLGPSNT